jgi:hypothetical protein
VSYIYARAPAIWIFHSQCHENIQGHKVQLSLIIDSALDNSCGQLHASATLLPGRNQYTHWIGACVISRATMGDIASCIIYFCPLVYSDSIWQHINSKFVVQCEDMVYIASQKSLCICTPLIGNIPQNELSCVFANRSGRHVHLYKHMAVILGVTWVGEKCVVLCCVVLWTEFCAKSAGGTVTLYKQCGGLTRQCFSWSL